VDKEISETVDPATAGERILLTVLSYPAVTKYPVGMARADDEE